MVLKSDHMPRGVTECGHPEAESISDEVHSGEDPGTFVLIAEVRDILVSEWTSSVAIRRRIRCQSRGVWRSIYPSSRLVDTGH